MSQHTKVALVTGGSRGLGKNMALKIAEKGLDVILTYHSKQAEAEAVAQQIRTQGQRAAILQLDVANPAGISQFVEQVQKVLAEEFGTSKIDFLVNNAGIGLHTPIGEATEEQFDRLMNVHLKSVLFLTQALLPHMQDGGGVISISSGLARFALPGYSVYAAMKGAIEVLTRYQAKELGGRGIRSNVIAPGAIETDFGGGAVRDNEQLNQMVGGMTALGRPGLPEDIGGVVAFLCTEEARWINAQRIEVSGGMLI